MDNRGEVWKLVLVVTPNIAAALIAVSRIMDARHHPFDVITGSLLGVFCAWASYRQYFPPVTEPWRKGRAYPIRSWATQPVAPALRMKAFDDSDVALRNPDEEQMDGGAYTQPRRSSVSAQSPPPGMSIAQPSLPHENNQFESGVYNRRRRERDDNWSSSSSEDVTDGYEMRRGYTRTANYAPTVQVSRYEPDTAYHPTTLQEDHPVTQSDSIAPPAHLHERPLA